LEYTENKKPITRLLDNCIYKTLFITIVILISYNKKKPNT
jgi:hypothetical protein